MSAITLGNLTVDSDRFTAWVDGREVPLTFTEFELLATLAEHPNHVVTREELIERGWQGRFHAGERALDIQITRLRRKLAGVHPWTLVTVRRRGYLLRNQQLPKAETEEPWRSPD